MPDYPTKQKPCPKKKKKKRFIVSFCAMIKETEGQKSSYGPWLQKDEFMMTGEALQQWPEEEAERSHCQP